MLTTRVHVTIHIISMSSNSIWYSHSSCCLCWVWMLQTPIMPASDVTYTRIRSCKININSWFHNYPLHVNITPLIVTCATAGWDMSQPKSQYTSTKARTLQGLKDAATKSTAKATMDSLFQPLLEIPLQHIIITPPFKNFFMHYWGISSTWLWRWIRMKMHRPTQIP